MRAAWVCTCTIAVAAAAAPNGETNPNPGSPVARHGAPRTERVVVWIDLSEPELASLSPDHPTGREAHRQRIVAEQNRVAAALRALGGVERGRIQLLRNSIAAELPREQVNAARRIPGVRAVRPVRDMNRQPPNPRD